eukprot:4356450-Ditylum_brightwellii.AAC.1
MFPSVFVIVDFAVDILSQYSVFVQLTLLVAVALQQSRGEKQLKLLFRFKTSSAAYAACSRRYSAYTMKCEEQLTLRAESSQRVEPLAKKRLWR